MRRFFISLLITVGILAGSHAAVTQHALPSIPPSLPSAESHCDYDLPALAVIKIDTFFVEGHSEPFVAFLLVDLSSGESICIVAAENAYRAIFRDIQSPLGLKVFTIEYKDKIVLFNLVRLIPHKTDKNPLTSDKLVEVAKKVKDTVETRFNAGGYAFRGKPVKMQMIVVVGYDFKLKSHAMNDALKKKKFDAKAVAGGGVLSSPFTDVAVTRNNALPSYNAAMIPVEKPTHDDMKEYSRDKVYYHEMMHHVGFKDTSTAIEDNGQVEFDLAEQEGYSLNKDLMAYGHDGMELAQWQIDSIFRAPPRGLEALIQPIHRSPEHRWVSNFSNVGDALTLYGARHKANIATAKESLAASIRSEKKAIGDGLKRWQIEDATRKVKKARQSLNNAIEYLRIQEDRTRWLYRSLITLKRNPPTDIPVGTKLLEEK